MTLIREQSGWTIECDGRHCELMLEVDSVDHNFSEVPRALRDNGWSYRKVRDEYIHLCPDCQDE